MSFTLWLEPRAGAYSTKNENTSYHVCYHDIELSTPCLRRPLLRRIVAAKGAAMARNYFTIKNCEFAFKCPRVWERLALTGKDDERHCTSCEKVVYLCVDDESLTQHVEAGHCVAVEDPIHAEKLVVGRVDSGHYTGTSTLTFD